MRSRSGIARTARVVFLSSVSFMAIACQPSSNVRTVTARVCDPKADATCKPTPHTKVVVR
jgi:hypothetical protein